MVFILEGNLDMFGLVDNSDDFSLEGNLDRICLGLQIGCFLSY